VRTVTNGERRARLATRHRLAAHRVPTVEDAARSVVGLHATDPSTIYLSSWARTRNFRHADLDRALYVDRSLVKLLAMRRTLFVFPRETLPAALHGASARVATSEGARLVRDVERAGLAGDGAGWLEHTAGQVIAQLAPGTPMTTTELQRSVPELARTIQYGEGKPWGGSAAVGPRVLATLSARGDVVRGPSEGTWMTSRPAWTTMASWLGEAVTVLDQARATAELVKAWLRTFGPGTERDLQWWLGDTLASVRRALVEVGAVEVALADGGRGHLLADDVEPTEPVEPWSALLPALDPATMGWKERQWYLGEHGPLLFDTAGNGGTTAWWDGRIVGAWYQPDGGEVLVHLLEDVGREGREALDREADRLTSWLDGARPGARWPSPLVGELTRQAR
jgi:hypothetical protein